MRQLEKLTVWVITLSDRASRGEYEDLSGPAIQDQVIVYFRERDIRIDFRTHLIPDDPGKLEELLIQARETEADVVFTTGGTGIGPRDFTPEIAGSIIEKELPGIMEMIRVKYGMVKPNALVSRGIAGVSGKTLIYTLPGSLRAVAEYCSEILPTILHSVKMVNGIDDHS